MDLFSLILDAVLGVLEAEVSSLDFLWDFLRALFGLTGEAAA